MTSSQLGNQAAWDDASGKHLREHAEMITDARSGGSLLDRERTLLAPILATGPEVVHLQSGNASEDVALINAGARSVVGVDFSAVAVEAAQRRADELGLACHYVIAELPPVPLSDQSADLIYTGKGALNWLPDLDVWAAEVARVLRPGGRLFVYEAHPLVPVYDWDADTARIRTDRSYFAREHVNDTFPARGAVEAQHTLAETIMAVLNAGLRLLDLAEYPEPFWRPDDVDAAVWDGRLPNAFSLLAQRPPARG